MRSACVMAEDEGRAPARRRLMKGARAADNRRMSRIKLGALAEAISGKSGNTVFYRLNDELHVKDYAIPTDPRTPGQLAARDRLARAADAWRSLSWEEAQAWRDYAQSLAVRQTGTTKVQTPRAQTLFCRLAIKFLQANAGADPPRTPPGSPFLGDGLAVTMAAESGIRFDASAPNSPGVVTELLVQPMRSAASMPVLRAYRSRAFAAFAPGSMSYTVDAERGLYACGYRFVRAATGQATEIAFAGLVAVG